MNGDGACVGSIGGGDDASSPCMCVCFAVFNLYIIIIYEIYKLFSNSINGRMRRERKQCYTSELLWSIRILYVREGVRLCFSLELPSFCVWLPNSLSLSLTRSLAFDEQRMNILHISHGFTKLTIYISRAYISISTIRNRNGYTLRHSLSKKEEKKTIGTMLALFCV